MKTLWLVLAALVLAVAADPALAAKKKKAPPRCVDQPYQFSWSFLWSTTEPQPNNCSPPVYEYGRYIGQDPDPNIRYQLRRDPATGYNSGAFIGN
ncbi:MAG: hypothetical protein ACK4UO_04405 [Pseudolabrys sp.]